MFLDAPMIYTDSKSSSKRRVLPPIAQEECESPPIKQEKRESHGINIAGNIKTIPNHVDNVKRFEFSPTDNGWRIHDDRVDCKTVFTDLQNKKNRIKEKELELSLSGNVRKRLPAITPLKGFIKIPTSEEENIEIKASRDGAITIPTSKYETIKATTSPESEYSFTREENTILPTNQEESYSENSRRKDI